MSASGLIRALLACAAMLPAVAAWADQAVSLVLSVKPERVGIEDTFDVIVTLTGSLDGDGTPTLPLGREFRVVDTSRSHSISVINGDVSVELRYTYVVQPLRQGFYDIGPAAVSHRGLLVESNRGRVEVVKGSVTGTQGTPRRPLPGDLFGDIEPRRPPKSGRVDLAASVDRHEVWVGQPIVYSLVLYTQLPVQRVQPRSDSEFPGMWSQLIEIPDPPKAERVTWRGEPCTAYLLKKLALFPIRAGEIHIEPAEWGVDVVESDFLLSTTRQLLRATDLITINVKALPDQGRPEGFDGAVGTYRVSASLDKSGSVEVDEAVALEVTVEGDGNLAMLPEPKLETPEDFRLYSSTASEPAWRKKGAIGGSRTWELVLVPRTPGEHAIPAIEYPYFDPAKGVYRVARSEPLALRVMRRSSPPPAIVGGGEQTRSGRSPEPAVRDVAHIRLHPGSLGEAAMPLYRRRLLLLSLGLPVLLNLALLALRMRSLRAASDPAGQRRRSALRTARARLSEARATLKRDPGSVAPAVATALSGYLADRFDVPAAGLTRERVMELLSGAAEGQREPWLRLVERLDYLRFTPAGGVGRELGSVVDAAEGLLRAVDRSPGRRLR